MSDNLFQERLRELEASVEEGKIYPKTIAATKALSSKLAKQDKAYAEWLQKQKEKKEKEQVKEGEKHSVPDTEREKDLAAAAHPKDKITHKDVLVKRGVLKAEGVEIEEKTLTPAELKKREEVAKATERDKPGMDKSKKMAIATAVAKRVAESEQIDELSKSTLGSYVKKAAVDMAIRHSSDTEDQRKQDDIYKSTYAKGGMTNADAEKALKAKNLDAKSLAKRVSKTYSRNAGIEKAVSRLTKESFGEIVELSKKTLGSYVKAAAKDAEQAGRDQEYHGHKNDYARGEKRQKGIAKAVDRMTKEDVEQVSELSKSTLTSYRDAAKERRKEHNSAIQRASSIKDTMGDENGILDKAISYHSKEHDRLGGKMKIAARKIKKIKEDVEQVSELSKTTLASYYAKSISDRHSKDLARDSAKRKGDEKEVDALGRKVTNRSSGLEKAKAKFFKEEAEAVDEGWKSKAAGVAVAAATVAGIGMSPKVHIDGVTYDKAVSAAPSHAKEVTHNGETYKIWQTKAVKHNRTNNLYQKVTKSSDTTK